MKIGISCYPSVGGSGVVATELGIKLAERGHQVHFISHGIPFRLGKYFRRFSYHEVQVNNYSVFQYPPYELQLASKMAQVVEREGLEILHVHYAIPHAASAYLAKQMVGGKVKVVTTLHGTDITVLGYDENLANLIRFAINESDAVTAVSDALIRETRELLGITREIKRIYNFVDTEIFHPLDVSTFKNELAPEGEKILLHMSNFRAVKRVEDVVHIFHRVRQEIPAKLVLIGEGPEMPHVRRLAREYGIEGEIYYLGNREDVAELVTLADILLLPSKKESFGLVALEAMACGVPVVGSLAGGIPEVVLHGQTGFLAPVGDVEKMSEYVVTLLKNPSLWREFSERGIARVKENFTAGEIVTQYEEVYRNLL
ncbi:N-acetyl-alpha-D-glucosaminyl L-malate synthase BshA [Thermicanus aegyptius]|uniref:N-acetyl-alpha-D-glucosaminyl L-malate synthase BshA n=1 Tax=Thermicanus aegyptius TaxID=94009 RepID=UPI000417B7D3|nr:N-acetyl-alpha-D-glucosaminyl L-malate synthase BshA [Thermicanus aegyptius]